MLLQTTLDNISESIVEYLGHKTPQVKGEVASFLARCFTRCTPAILTKKLLKLFVTPLLKVIFLLKKIRIGVKLFSSFVTCVKFVKLNSLFS